ncbi:MAG TPA: YetF domain-containing protein [Flavobacteriales bacterium]
MSDLRTLFLGDHSWIFLLECALRTVLMFVFALLLMKITGKKEVRQFSVLELLVIIGLGSALGDAMIYTDAPILPSLVSIGVVLLCYWALNKWTNHAPRLEALIEGRVTRVLQDGVIDLQALDSEGLSVTEFLGELRVMQVEHLGQVKAAHVEIDGEVSIFFRADAEVVPGLPLAPDVLVSGTSLQQVSAFPACCVHCGNQRADGNGDGRCGKCGKDEWVPAVSFERVA